MRILFCDDEETILNQIQRYVAEFFKGVGGEKPDFAAYTSGDDLLKTENRADIAFLDVEMPGTSGIFVGAELKKKNPNIKIFIVTSYPDYLDEAMRFQVFRYLSKPIDKNRLFRNLKDALYQYNVESHEYPIPTVDELVVRRAEEIVFVETDGRKSIVHAIDGDYTSIESFTHWQETLQLPCFYETHRSYIINMRFVSDIAKDRIRLKYNGNEQTAYLTRRKYADFKRTYLMYLESVR